MAYCLLSTVEAIPVQGPAILVFLNNDEGTYSRASRRSIEVTNPTRVEMQSQDNSIRMLGELLTIPR